MIRTALRKSALLMGRKSLYRLSRFLSMTARADVPNDLATNGEIIPQQVAMRLSSHPVVFDVGANIGDWTKSMLAIAGNRPVSVHAFEPCTGTFEQLESRVQSPAVLPVRRALGRKAGIAQLAVIAAGSGRNSLVHDVEAETSETVQVSTVDDYCLEHSIPAITLLKIDAEGYDFEVIAGAEKMLRSHSVALLQFEYNQCWISSRNLLKDAFNFLCPMGYVIGKLVGNAVEFYPRWHWEMETYRETNYLACLSEYRKHFPEQAPTWLFS